MPDALVDPGCCQLRSHQEKLISRMTELNVDPGICGLPSVLTVTREAGKRFSVLIRSECPMVQSIQDDLADLDWRDIFQPMLENPVYLAASKKLSHASCPIPSGILKTLEVAAEMALPKDVHMMFSTPPVRKDTR